MYQPFWLKMIGPHWKKPALLLSALASKTKQLVLFIRSPTFPHWNMSYIMRSANAKLIYGLFVVYKHTNGEDIKTLEIMQLRKAETGKRGEKWKTKIPAATKVLKHSVVKAKNCSKKIWHQNQIIFQILPSFSTFPHPLLLHTDREKLAVSQILTHTAQTHSQPNTSNHSLQCLRLCLSKAIDFTALQHSVVICSDEGRQSQPNHPWHSLGGQPEETN